MTSWTWESCSQFYKFFHHALHGHQLSLHIRGVVREYMDAVHPEMYIVDATSASSDASLLLFLWYVLQMVISPSICIFWRDRVEFRVRWTEISWNIYIALLIFKKGIRYFVFFKWKDFIARWLSCSFFLIRNILWFWWKYENSLQECKLIARWLFWCPVCEILKELDPVAFSSVK